VTEGRVRGAATAKPSSVGLGEQEKPLARCKTTVPQTDTGGLVEYTKVDEGTSVKELGNLTP
jgi:hypothetical protein